MGERGEEKMGEGVEGREDGGGEDGKRKASREGVGGEEEEKTCSPCLLAYTQSSTYRGSSHTPGSPQAALVP